MIPVRDSADGASFAVKVHPRARRSAITGILGEGGDAVLKVSLNAPAVEGRANEAILTFFAELCSVPRSGVSILSGNQSRNKVIQIRGCSAKEIEQALAKHLPDQKGPA